MLTGLPSSLGNNWGRLIFKFPTKNIDAETQFPDGLGRFVKNNKEIDCYCNNCPV